VGDIVEWDLEGVMLSNFKLENGAVEIGRAPVPAFHAQLLVQHLQVVAAAKMFGHAVSLRFFESSKSERMKI